MQISRTEAQEVCARWHTEQLRLEVRVETRDAHLAFTLTGMVTSLTDKAVIITHDEEKYLSLNLGKAESFDYKDAREGASKGARMLIVHGLYDEWHCNIFELK